MSETVDLGEAQACMDAAVAIAAQRDASASTLTIEWIGLVERFSALCEKVKYRSSIAVLGNALLAKAANERIDVFSLKASADHPGAYDARRPAEKILVPASQRNKFHLGVTGPQPLNNQPFFRTMRIESRMTVRDNARPLLAELLGLLHRVGLMRRPEAIEALAGFIIVRRRFVPTYERPPGQYAIETIEELGILVQSFVATRSEGGGRAMACAAGILDAAFGERRIRLGKINEPDRKVPGDIGLRQSDAEDAAFERVLEIRDKGVAAHTIHASVAKAIKAGVAKMTVLAVNEAQATIDVPACLASARDIGADLVVFIGWSEFIASLGAWTATPERIWVETSIVRIRVRLQDLGLSTVTVQEWDAGAAIAAKNGMIVVIPDGS